MNLKKNLILLMMVIIGGFTFSACNDNDDDYTYYPYAAVQFVNAYTGSDVLGISIGGNPVRMEYGKYLQYSPIAIGSYNLTAGLPNTSSPIVDSTITLKDSTSYTSVIYGTEGKATSILVEDKQPSDYDQGKSYIRFFNVADATGPLNVKLISNAEPLSVFSDRPLDNQSSATQNQDFKPVSTGIYTIQFTDASGNTLAEREETVELKAGGYYTIIARGVKDDTETPLKVGFIDHSGRQQ